MIQNILEGDLVWVSPGAGTSSPGLGLVIGYREVLLYDHNAKMVDYDVLFNEKVLQLSHTQLKRMCWSNDHLLKQCSKLDGSQRRGI